MSSTGLTGVLWVLQHPGPGPQGPSWGPRGRRALESRCTTVVPAAGRTVVHLVTSGKASRHVAARVAASDSFEQASYLVLSGSAQLKDAFANVEIMYRIYPSLMSTNCSRRA